MSELECNFDIPTFRLKPSSECDFSIPDEKSIEKPSSKKLPKDTKLTLSDFGKKPIKDSIGKLLAGSKLVQEARTKAASEKRKQELLREETKYAIGSTLSIIAPEVKAGVNMVFQNHLLALYDQYPDLIRFFISFNNQLLEMGGAQQDLPMTAWETVARMTYYRQCGALGNELRSHILEVMSDFYNLNEAKVIDFNDFPYLKEAA